MEYFILSYTWCVLNTIFKIFGFQPCQKVEKAGLKPTPACKFWAKYVTVLGLMILIQSCVTIYFVVVESDLRFLLEYGNEVIFPKSTDKFAFACNMIVVSILHYICIKNARQFAKKLSEVQNYVNSNAILYLMDIKKSMFQCNLRVAPLFLVMVASVLLMESGFFLQLKVSPELSVSTEYAISAIFLATLPTLFYYLPMMYIMLIYVEVIVVMKNWSHQLKKQKFSQGIIEEAKTFMDGLNLVCDTFSSFLFWITSLLFLNAIAYAYITFTRIGLLFSPKINLIGWSKFLQMLGFILLVLFILYLLFTLCWFSEKMRKSVQELKSAIKDVHYGMNKADAICLMLDDFKGFDANGYFTLNNSLLTGMTSGLATFLVILIQFNQSEIE